MKKTQQNNQMNIEQKANFLLGKNFWHTFGIDELNIPSVSTADGPMGVRKVLGNDILGKEESTRSVSYPSTALIASSFDRDLVKELGEHLGKVALSQGVELLLGPGVNIKRSPLAGRNFEYFSEDPLVSGELGAAYINGVQSQGVGAVVKHFAAYNRENQRLTATSNLDERTLREIYLRQFEIIINKSKPVSVMASYNPINGILATENVHTLTDILRNEWQFDGFVMSDWNAVKNTIAAIKAGVDLQMPGSDSKITNEIVRAVKNGELSEEQLNISVNRIVSFLQNNSQLKDKKEENDVDFEKEHAFSRKLAASSTVLLKNKNNILPLDKKEKVTYIGAYVDEPRWQGGGSSRVNPYKVVSTRQALEEQGIDFDYARGYEKDGSINQQLINEAIEAANKNDVVVLVVGLSEEQESEGYDKNSIQLPENQTQLINTLVKMNKKIIVVIQSGSPIEMLWLEKIDGLVYTYLAGEAAGEAMVDVLYGDVNPSGKLAETFPIRVEDTPAYQTFGKDQFEENYHEGLFVGYRFYDSRKMQVAFPFGFGLSYTSFKISNLKIKVDNSQQKVFLSVDIQNTGNRFGKEVVQVYVENKASVVERPIHELKEFLALGLEPGEKKTIEFQLNVRSFSWYNTKSENWQIDEGEYAIQIGLSSRDIQLSQTIMLSWQKDEVILVGQSVSKQNSTEVS